MRHVGQLIGHAIHEQVCVPWDQVHSKAPIRGTKSTMSDDEAFRLEQRFLIPRTGSGDTEVQVETAEAKYPEIPKEKRKKVCPFLLGYSRGNESDRHSFYPGNTTRDPESRSANQSMAYPDSVSILSPLPRHWDSMHLDIVTGTLRTV
jgi:hypothetical protein